MVTALVLGGLIAQSSGEATLERRFKSGERAEYGVECHLHSEYKYEGMQFFMPQEYGVKYRFTTQVQSLLADGFARVLYERPTMSLMEGETAEDPPKTTVEKTNWKLQLDMSPINEITKLKDLAPPKPQTKGDERDLWTSPWSQQDSTQEQMIDPIAPMFLEIRGLALFLGNLDSSLDLNPKLPLGPVQVGSTWKKTVSYQPRQLAGSDRQAMQRLDKTYRYDGVVQSEGRSVHRITAEIDLDTDAAPWINQVFGQTPEESGLHAAKLKLKTTIAYDLEQNTLGTLLAVAESSGEFSITLDANKESPVYSEKLKGKSTMTLVKRS